MSGWSAQQAQWLRALGYPVLVRREPDWPQGAARAGGALPEERTGPPPQRSGSEGAPPPPAGLRARDTTSRPPRRDAPSRPGTGPTAAPPAADTSPASAAPRTDTSAKLVAIAQARRERDFGNPRFAPLLEQLLRAAGLEGDAGRERLRAMEVELSRLHRDPAAKRALWPALRALRRESRQ